MLSVRYDCRSDGIAADGDQEIADSHCLCGCSRPHSSHLGWNNPSHHPSNVNVISLDIVTDEHAPTNVRDILVHNGESGGQISEGTAADGRCCYWWSGIVDRKVDDRFPPGYGWIGRCLDCNRRIDCCV